MSIRMLIATALSRIALEECSRCPACGGPGKWHADHAIRERAADLRPAAAHGPAIAERAYPPRRPTSYRLRGVAARRSHSVRTRTCRAICMLADDGEQGVVDPRRGGADRAPAQGRVVRGGADRRAGGDGHPGLCDGLRRGRASRTGTKSSRGSCAASTHERHAKPGSRVARRCCIFSAGIASASNRSRSRTG